MFAWLFTGIEGFYDLRSVERSELKRKYEDEAITDKEIKSVLWGHCSVIWLLTLVFHEAKKIGAPMIAYKHDHYVYF